jgi:aminopeptidase N
VGGEPATFVYTNDNTALRIDLDTPLLPGQAVTVGLTWRLEIPSWTDQPAVYALFGRSQEMISLPLFYPSLAVYTDGPTLGAGQWWLTNGTERGDAAFNVASLFAVTLTLPAGWTPVTSGTEISTQEAGAQTQHVFVTGPSREFLFHASPAFSAVSSEAYGTRVTSYYLPGSEAAAQAALKYAVQALRIYSDHFGEYPFTDMRVAPAPITFRGMEYPQAILLGVETYTRFRDKLEMLTVHEMAHQWWYQIVHNDPVAEPWLDEALAEFSMRLYMENTRGEDDAQRLVVQRWQTPLDGLKAKQQDTAVDQPVPAFLNGTQYETIVYAKGALFYDTVRDTIGVRRFDRFLQNYARKYRWQIVDSAQWLDGLRDLPDPALLTLFEEWIREPAPAAPVQ